MMVQVTRRELLTGAAALGASTPLPGALTPASAQTTQKRDLGVAQGGDISKFDPHFSTSSNDIRVSFNLFDNLVARRPDGKLHAALATEWKLHGQTEWTFKIRPGVKWHNGDPFTAADAAFSLARTWDPKVGTRVSTVFTTIDRIETPDPATLVIHTKKPDPLLPARLAFYGGQIVPQKYVEKVAIDRQAIVKELWRGRGIGPNGPIAKGDNHFDAKLAPLAYHPGEARERLRKGAYRGEEVVIETTVGYTANDKPMAEAIQGMWRDVGINAKVEVLEYSVRAQKNRDKSFKGLWWSDPTSTLGDPDGMMWRLLSPGGPQDYWRHPRFDELGEAARFSVDEKFRAEAYREMTKIFLEHFPWVPVIQPYEDYGLQKYVEWTPNPNQQFEVRRFNLKLRRA